MNKRNEMNQKSKTMQEVIRDKCLILCFTLLLRERVHYALYIIIDEIRYLMST